MNPLARRATEAVARLQAEAVGVVATPVRVDRPLALKGIRGHLCHTAGTVSAVYTLGDAHWWNTSPAHQRALIEFIQGNLAGLAGHDIQLRVSWRPLNPVEWAATMRLENPRPLADVDGSGRSWERRLRYDQEFLAGRYERVVQLRVSLGRAPRPGQALPDALSNLEQTVFETLGHIGLGAARSTAAEVAWMVHRSTAPGIDAPGLPDWATSWDVGDMAEFGDAHWTATSFGRTVQVTAYRNGYRQTRHVAVVTMGIMEDHTLKPTRSAHDRWVPWLSLAEQLTGPDAEGRPANLPFHVDVVLSAKIRPGHEQEAIAEEALNRALGVERHYAQHHKDPPPKQAKVVAHAKEIWADTMDDAADRSTKADVVIRFAVYAETREQCLGRVRALIHAYRSTIRAWPVHDGPQPELLREFTYGAPVDYGAHVRKMGMAMLAAGVPNAADKVGTPGGFILGVTAGHARAHPSVVHLDGHYPMERLNRSGLTAVTGTLGSGKSVLGGAVAYDCASRGIRTALLDGSPQGPMARLTALPELSPYSLHISLDQANPGLLSPYRLIPDPSREGLADQDWRAACQEARSKRQEIALDAMLDMLPDSVRFDTGVERKMYRAVHLAPADVTASLWTVLDQFGVLDSDTAEIIRGIALGSARFMFGDPGTIPPLLKDALLTVITLGNLQLPHTSDRSRWTAAERYAVVKVNLATQLLTSIAYRGDPHARVCLINDEMRWLTYWPSAKSTVIDPWAFDMRKYNGWPLFIGQATRHITDLGIGEFVSWWLLFRQDSPEEAARAIQAAGQPPGTGLEEILQHLPTGHCLMVDPFRGQAKVVRQIEVLVRDQRLLDQVGTTPTPLAKESDPDSNGRALRVVGA